MISSLDRETTQVQLASQAINTLRQIRGSAFEWIARPYPVVGVDKAVRDAEAVGETTAQYLIDPLNGNSDNVQRDRLEALLGRINCQYGRNRAFATYEGAAQIKVKDFLATRLSAYRFLANTSDLMEHEDLWKILRGSDNNRLMPDLNIFQRRLGIVSPLSSDYFNAVLLKRFIQIYTTLPAFQLKPLILSGSWIDDSKETLGQRDPVFDAAVDEIAIWTNIDNSFRTRTAATQAIGKIYPGKLKYGAYPR